jgi:hypothetical protein
VLIDGRTGRGRRHHAAPFVEPERGEERLPYLTKIVSARGTFYRERNRDMTRAEKKKGHEMTRADEETDANG